MKLSSPRMELGTALFLALTAAASVAGSPSPEAQTKLYLEEIRLRTGTPAISVAVVTGGRLVYSGGVGFADLDNLVPATGVTVYNIGSVSKVISAVAVMQLVEKGKVELDDPIQNYVPSFPKKRWRVTVREILTHTSGIRHYRSTDFSGNPEHNQNWKPFSSLKEATEIFKDDPLLFQPGAYYLYSSYAVNLLQGVVETASGMGFEEYMRNQIWRPAGMLQTAFDISERIVPHRAKGYLVDHEKVRNHSREDVSYKFASGGMISTAEDLARFGIALHEGRLMKPETVRFMLSPQLDDVLHFEGDDPPTPLRWQQALMWRIRKDDLGRDYLNICGTVMGFNACLVSYQEQNVQVAILGNGYPVNPALREARAIAQFFIEVIPDDDKR